MANVKQVNYTVEQTAELAQFASDNGPLTQEVAKVFAEKFGKGLRSVVAKASRMGIYSSKTYETKNGEKPVKKDSVADAIGNILKLSEADTDSLAKANKKALQAVFDALANSVPING